MLYLKNILILIFSLSLFGAFSMFAWADYISFILLLFLIAIVFYIFFKGWSLNKYLWLVIPIFLQGIIFFNLIPSEKCDSSGNDTWSVKCECNGIKISEPIFGSSNCIGKVYNCKQRTPNGWKAYYGYLL